MPSPVGAKPRQPELVDRFSDPRTRVGSRERLVIRRFDLCKFAR